jgi:hypothetical protein
MVFPNIECALKTAASRKVKLKIFVVIQPNRSRNKITNPATDNTIKLFESNLGVASSLRKFVKSIKGSEMLKITFDNISFEAGVRTLKRAEMAPIMTITERMKI